jgi:hypothetical protein
VPKSDNDSYVPAEKQGKLVGVLSNLLRTQCQKANENDELDAKLMAENHKLADGLREQLQHEITKVTDDISQPRVETRQETQSTTDHFNKLSAGVDMRVSRHINRSRGLHDNLRNEMSTGVNLGQ